jgi:hypothetical protein
VPSVRTLLLFDHDDRGSASYSKGWRRGRNKAGEEGGTSPTRALWSNKVDGTKTLTGAKNTTQATSAAVRGSAKDDDDDVRASSPMDKRSLMTMECSEGYKKTVRVHYKRLYTTSFAF